MNFLTEPADFMALASTALLFLLTTNRALHLRAEDENQEVPDEFLPLEQSWQVSTVEMEAFTHAALHTFRLSNIFSLLDDDLRYWIKPRSTAWFFQFLLEQYDDELWIRMFHMTKSSVMSLAELLKPCIFKKDTKYRLAIPVLVRVACTLFKLTHGASLLICSEMFAVGRSTVSMVLREVVQAINVVLRSEISWPTGQKLLDTEAGFKQLCGLLGVLGAMDGTHVNISKPKQDPANYFYFKSGGYTINCQAVVDSNKRFLDLYLGMPGSTKDSRILQRSSLHHRAMQNILWDAGASFHGFSPYLVVDSGYPLLPWLMVPHRSLTNLPLAETLFNKKLRRGRGVVGNTFGILKLSFQELLLKSNLDVIFLPDVIMACAILHNMLLGQSHEEVERLFHILRIEGLNVIDNHENIALAEIMESPRDDVDIPQAVDKRRDLSVYLALQRTSTT